MKLLTFLSSAVVILLVAGFAFFALIDVQIEQNQIIQELPVALSE